MSGEVDTFYNEHDGRLRIQWMSGGFTEVDVSEDLTLIVQGRVRGVIVGVEIPQPRVIGKLCLQLGRAEPVIQAAHAMAKILDEFVEDGSRHAEVIETTLEKFRKANHEYVEAIKENLNG